MAKTKEELWLLFQSIGRKALTMSHYDLAQELPETTLDDWRKFLQETDVEDFIKIEMKIITDAVQKKLLADITDGSDKSVGRAQLIGTLDKLSGANTTKEGPVFIYTYVPLDSEQKQAENVIQLNRDPFKKRRTNEIDT